MANYSDDLKAKAIRFIENGAVTRLPGIGGGVKVWLVKGDRDDYTVITRVGRQARGRCSCMAGRHGKFCSHTLAALIAHGQETGYNSDERKAAA